jgi:required for meiotic nuclear division protein 1
MNSLAEMRRITESPKRDPLGTFLTPVETNACKLTLRAVYFESPIDLGALQARYPLSQVLSTDPLVLGLPGNAHVVVLRFGAVVFWDCNGLQSANVLEQIQQIMNVPPPNCEARDSVVVLLDQAEERVNFKDIWLQKLTLEHIRVISESIGQSVALKHCELSVTKALKNATPIVQALQRRGALIASEKSILKTVGFTLAIRDAILAKLSLFDDPAETWQSERLSRLHNLLGEHFDITKRLSALNEKLTFLSDLNTMLMSLLHNRTSHRLEWVVILLIVTEVIFSFYHLFSSFQ